MLDRVEPQGQRTVSYPVRSDVRGRYPVGPLSVRATVVDTTTSGTVTTSQPAQPLTVTVNPIADPVTPPVDSLGYEDAVVAFGADLANATTGIRVVDSVVGFQERSGEIIAEMRKLATQNSTEIREAVEAGKKRVARLASSIEALPGPG